MIIPKKCIWRSVKLNIVFNHNLFFVITELHGSVHHTVLSLQNMIMSTSYRTKLVKMMNLHMKMYNSVTHNMVLMLVNMAHWTYKHKENNLNMTPYHDVGDILWRFTSTMMNLLHDSCSVVLQLTLMHWAQKHTKKFYYSVVQCAYNNINRVTAFQPIDVLIDCFRFNRRDFMRPVCDWVNRVLSRSTYNRSFRTRVFPGNHLHWYWQHKTNRRKKHKKHKISKTGPR